MIINALRESGFELMDNPEANTPAAFLLDLESSRKIPITMPKCRVGRDIENDIVIPDDTSISRFQVMFTFENGKYLISDAESRNGTFLNGNKVTVPEPVNDGDVLKMGASIFWIVIETEPA